MTERRVFLPLLILLTCAVTPSQANPLPHNFDRAAAAEMQGIAFLHLRLHPGTVELLDVKITPGRLKPGAEHPGERILLQVQSRGGSLLWEGTMADPRRRVVEGAEDEHGRRARQVVERAAPEVTARVPFFEEGQEIRVFRVSPGKEGAAHHTLLGTFRLGK